MKYLQDLISFIYAYCTDFVINLANLLDLSYYEVNAIIFCVIWPLVTIVLMALNIHHIILYKRVYRQKNI